MLYINFENGLELQAHYDDKAIRDCAVDRVEAIQADGDELEHIKDNFTHLPMRAAKRVQTWFGDDAKFICANW